MAPANPPRTAYKVVGTPDLNGDGYPEIVFQNQNTGQLVYWLMQGSVEIGCNAFPTTSALTPDIKVVGFADLSQDGSSDAVLQSQSTGNLSYIYLAGSVILSTGNFSYPSNLLDATWKAFATR